VVYLFQNHKNYILEIKRGAEVWIDRLRARYVI